MRVRKTLVAVLGHPLCGDDALGTVVAQRLQRAVPPEVAVAHLVNPMDLLDLCPAYERMVVVDAVCSGAPPGTLYRWEVGTTPPPRRGFRGLSTYGLGLHEVLELARSLGLLPPRTVVLGVEGRSFHLGAFLSEEVRRALDRLLEWVWQETECTR